MLFIFRNNKWSTKEGVEKYIVMYGNIMPRKSLGQEDVDAGLSVFKGLRKLLIKGFIFYGFGIEGICRNPYWMIGGFHSFL